jgi:hypothetical protein
MNVFNDDEWLAIVARLIRFTREGKLKWSMVEGQDDGLSVIVGRSEFYLGSVDRDGRAPYLLEVGDPVQRETIDRLESEPIPDSPPIDWNGEPILTAAQMLPELYVEAFRVASGARQIYDQLLSDLDTLGQSPEPY